MHYYCSRGHSRRLTGKHQPGRGTRTKLRRYGCSTREGDTEPDCRMSCWYLASSRTGLEEVPGRPARAAGRDIAGGQDKLAAGAEQCQIAGYYL